MEGTIFNIQRFSLYDGPGVRTVVFLKGCPLRCVWCHNPESYLARPQVMYNPDRCIGCGECVAACPKNCHTLEQGLHGLDRTSCIDCCACAENCYTLALTRVGQSQTADQVLETVLQDKKNYDATGGGLTLSGGEPLAQATFSAELLKKARENGIHTCLETSGFGSWEKLQKLAEYTDLVLFDYKATGDETHKKLCGVPQTPILENLARLNEMGKQVILRCPLIPELNGDETHLRGIADTANRYDCILEVQLEPYHRLGIGKSQQLGQKPAFEAQPPEKEWTEDFAKRLQALCPATPVRIS